MGKQKQKQQKPPPKPPLTTAPTTIPATASTMDAKQLLNTFPSYISLYKTIARNPNPNSSPTADRSAILRWFSTLSPPQRLSHLTIVDHSFTQILLEMLSTLHRSPSHVTFIALPDLPSRGSLPSLCSRRSRGLLARIAESDEAARFVRSSIRLFSSNEGQDFSRVRVRDRECMDTVTFCEKFVEDIDKFVKVMDSVSGAGFLNGSDWGELGSDWPELRWLKAKGYYSLEELVANRVEVALRLAWANCNSGKKRGVKLKDKVKASNAVGLGANVYWRKRGCVEWWHKLDVRVKGKAFRMILARAAKSLTPEILKDVDGFTEDGLLNFGVAEQSLSRDRCDAPYTAVFLRRDGESNMLMGSTSSSSKPPTSLLYAVNRLLVLQAIVSMVVASDDDKFDEEKLFFSSLDSVNSISDAILRKLRGLIMDVSLNSTTLELLEEENKRNMPSKSKEKLATTNSKKKGKKRNAKRLNPAPKISENGFLPVKTRWDGESGLHDQNLDLGMPKMKDGTLEGASGSSVLLCAQKEETFQTPIPDIIQTSAPKNQKQNRKKKSRGKCDVINEVRNTSSELLTVSASSVTTQREGKRQSSVALEKNLPNNTCIVSENDEQKLDSCDYKVGSSKEDLASDEPGKVSLDGRRTFLFDSCLSSNKVNNVAPVAGKLNNISVHNDKECCKDSALSQTVPKSGMGIGIRSETVAIHAQGNGSRYNGQPVISVGHPSYEWPTVTPVRLTSFIPPATDRLHLEVGHNRQNHVQHSFIQQSKSSREGRTSRIMAQPMSTSFDWPPMVRTCNFDSTFISRRQSFAAQSSHVNEEERNYSTDCFDLYDQTTAHEIADEYDGHWVSEDEYEVHAVSGIDYNQYFGGGVMYWNPSDYRGAGFSRPTSLSSDDSSWAWREADMNRTVDDMVAFSSSYSTNGLTSPSAAPFCSPFESLTPGHQAIGFVRSGSEIPGKTLHNLSAMNELDTEEKVPGSLANIPSDSDAKSGDSLPYPILRPIIIPNISRDRSRSEFKGNRDLRSPHVPPNRRERPWIKRPPSPVVLCVPRAPCPPPPSPVGDSRKHRGFPTVRSGSSSPRQWGMRGWFHDGGILEEARVRVDGAEVVWPSWANKSFSPRQIVQPLTGAILQDHLIAISHLTHDQEHPDVSLPLQPPDLLNCPIRKTSLPLMHNLLHEEIDSFCKQVAAENLIRRPYIGWAVKRVTRSLQVLWPRSRTNIFGSNATGLSLPTSDVDLVVCLPPVRNLEPIKEAGILEGRNSIKETCLQHAARYLGNQEWVKADSLKTVENTAIPIIMLVVDVPHDFVTASISNVHTYLNEQSQPNNGQGTDQSDSVGSDTSSPDSSELLTCNKDAVSVRLDISFKSPSHTGLQTTELVKQLTDQFPAAIPLALVLKQFLADRSLDQSYSGGLSSYCLVLLIVRFLQHEHHLGRPINQNLGSLFMDFLYFFGNVFDPRQMRISIQGSGIYINRERGYSIDPIYIDDPLFQTNNVGKNCFRIHQCIKAFADAYSILENELNFLAKDGEVNTMSQYRLLPKIISSICLP